EAATQGLSALVDDGDADLAVRERAFFALSLRPAEESLPALLRVADSTPSPKLRKRAAFWLGPSTDPRALAYFERVLAGKPCRRRRAASSGRPSRRPGPASAGIVLALPACRRPPAPIARCSVSRSPAAASSRSSSPCS